MHVLLAEDNRTNQILVSLVLEGQGFTVTVAENGRIALDLLKKQIFDVVLLDINMPEMNGYDVIQRLRAHHANGDLAINQDIPVIAMTAHDGADIREKCIEAGMNDYVRKPIHADTLFEVINRYLAKDDDISQPINTTQVAKEEGVLNLARLTQLLGNDNDKVLKIINAFVERLPQEIYQIQRAIQSKNAKVLERHAHALKGSASNFGAKEVVTLAAQLEQHGQEHRFEGTWALFERFKQVAEPMQEALLAEKQKIKSTSTSTTTTHTTLTQDNTKVRILIAEDDPASQMVLEGFLEQWGHEVIVTSNGEEAWQMMQGENPPQIAVLDWMMPKLDGIEVCKRIRSQKQRRYVYILLLTAKGLKEDRMLGFSAGADDYITKPFESADLKARVDAGVRLVQQENALAAQRDQLREDLELGMEQSTQYVGLIHFMAELRKHETEAAILSAVERNIEQILKIKVNLWERDAQGNVVSLGSQSHAALSERKQAKLQIIFANNNKVIFKGKYPQYIKEDEFVLEIVESGEIDLSLDLLPLYMSHFHISLIAARQRERIEQEQVRYRKLMENILPKTVAEELMLCGNTVPRLYEEVTVVFTDFAGFTKAAQNWQPERVLQELGHYFDYFDQMTEQYQVEKLKTIGDGYMYAGGLPEESRTHAIDCVLTALELQHFVATIRQQRLQENQQQTWEVRIGIHTGSVMAGVVGSKKFAYDIWGDTVNTASRMESAGVPGQINISESTYHSIKMFFQCEYRGEFEVKGKGIMKMYLVTGILPKLCEANATRQPNALFHQKYTALKAESSEAHYVL